jgi:hypothetical protein
MEIPALAIINDLPKFAKLNDGHQNGLSIDRDRWEPAFDSTGLDLAC